ncbi:hypothetical protein MKEN_00114500 [Mycena kentingensis (nom. inval.)]|nr:hypothetical protein MKEN_00114500 [Mycena kentingensis (nom. inval.)]
MHSKTPSTAMVEEVLKSLFAVDPSPDKETIAAFARLTGLSPGEIEHSLARKRAKEHRLTQVRPELTKWSPSFYVSEPLQVVPAPDNGDTIDNDNNIATSLPVNNIGAFSWRCPPGTNYIYRGWSSYTDMPPYERVHFDVACWPTTAAAQREHENDHSDQAHLGENTNAHEDRGNSTDLYFCQWNEANTPLNDAPNNDTPIASPGSPLSGYRNNSEGLLEPWRNDPDFYDEVNIERPDASPYTVSYADSFSEWTFYWDT